MEKLSCTAGIYDQFVKLWYISRDFGDEIFKNFAEKYVPGPPRTQLHGSAKMILPR